MKEIIYITDPRILNIPIKECGESLVDLRMQDELQYGPAPECDLTTNDYTKLRKAVYEKLCLAQRALPNNWRFRIYEGYRSLVVQKQLFDQQFQRVCQMYPHWDYHQRFTETTRLVSPVENLDGTLNTPVHNTGAAVDVEILDADNQLVDMGMTAKDWTVVDPDLCLTHYENLSQEVKHHRQILLTVMESHGFINYPTEWWHFSYGDRYWAYHTKASQAIYGSADSL